MAKIKFHFMASTLHTRRKYLKLSQKDVARRLGFHVQFISNMERGKCSLPVKYFTALAVIFKMPVSRLINAHLADEKVRLTKEVSKWTK